MMFFSTDGSLPFTSVSSRKNFSNRRISRKCANGSVHVGLATGPHLPTSPGYVQVRDTYHILPSVAASLSTSFGAAPALQA